MSILASEYNIRNLKIEESLKKPMASASTDGCLSGRKKVAFNSSCLEDLLQRGQPQGRGASAQWNGFSAVLRPGRVRKTAGSGRV